jgi:phage/plasmid-associated DNA primase
MKQLTSGIDPIQARAPYMPQSISFIPQFKLTLCCNELMVIKSQDHGTWRRIRVVDFLSLFVDKPVTNDPDKPYQFLLDKNIKEKFLYWKEIFAGMLVLKAFETNGNVNDCNMVLQSSNEYRNSQDYVAEFIADKIIVDINGKITKSEITQEFNSWYLGTYGKGGPSPKEVQSYMDKKYGPFKLQKCWKGVRINYDTDITTDTPNEDSEFDLDQQFDIIENL